MKLMGICVYMHSGYTLSMCQTKELIVFQNFKKLIFVYWTAKCNKNERLLADARQAYEGFRVRAFGIGHCIGIPNN